MDIFVLIIGFLFLQFDINLLKRRAWSVFQDVFRISNREAMLFWILLGLASWQTYRAKTSVLGFACFLLSVIYVLRRVDFFKRLKNTVEYENQPDENLDLALSTFSILGWWFGWLLFVEVIMSSMLEILHRPQNDLASILFMSEMASIIFVVLIYRAVRRYKNLKLFQVLGLETKGLGFLKVWVVPAVFAFSYAVLTTKLLTDRPVQPITPLQELLQSTTSLKVIILFVSSAILTAPFFEEIIFRGFFFHVLKPFMGTAFAILFVALSFGLLHVDQYWGDWAAIVVVGCFGLLLTLYRAWSGSSVPGMIAHYVYNTTLTIVPVIAILMANPIYWEYQLNFPTMSFAQKEEVLLKSVKMYPEFSAAYNDLAWLYTEQSIQLDQALSLVNQALKLEPDNYAYLDTKAEVYFKMGRISEAIAMEEDLVKKYPHDAYLKEQLNKYKKAQSVNSLKAEVKL